MKLPIETMKITESQKELKRLLFVIFQSDDYFTCNCKDHNDLRKRLLKYLEDKKCCQ